GLLGALTPQSRPKAKLNLVDAYVVDVNRDMVITGATAQTGRGALFDGAIGRDFLVALNADLSSYPAKLVSALFSSRAQVRNLIFYPRDMRNDGPVGLSGAAVSDATGAFIGYRFFVQDLSPSTRTAKELSHYQSILNAFAAHVPNLVVVKDIEGRYLTANPL